MKGDTVAKRYAHALFAIGREKGAQQLEQYGSALAALTEAYAGSDTLKRLFRAPVISAGEKDRVVQKLLGTMQPDPVLRNFFRLLAEKERLSLLPSISAVYGRLADKQAGISRGTLTTAVVMDEKRRITVVNALEKQAGGKLKLNFEVNPSILGGIVLRMGDTVMDGSLKAQLNVLKENIKRGE